MINVALAGDHALNLHALASLFHALPGIRVVSISRSPATLIRNISASSAIFVPGSISGPASAPVLSSVPVHAPTPKPDSTRALATVSFTDCYPNIVLLDVNFELRPATQVINFIKKSHPAIRLIVLGLTRDEEAIARIFRSGADRYLPKNSDPLILEHAIREIATAPSSAPASVPSAASPAPAITTIPAACNAVSDQRPLADREPDYNPAFSTWPTVTDTEYRYFKLAISDVSNEDIRKKLQICESSYTRLMQQTYDRFNVRSRDGLAVALFKQRWLVRDDL